MSAILCSLLSARPWPLAEPISTSQMMSGHHSALRAPPDPTYLLGEQTQPLLWSFAGAPHVPGRVACTSWPLLAGNRSPFLAWAGLSAGEGPSQSCQCSPGEERMRGVQPLATGLGNLLLRADTTRLALGGRHVSACPSGPFSLCLSCAPTPPSVCQLL